MRALLAIVGLYRAPYAWILSRKLLQKANVDIIFETHLFINRVPTCGESFAFLHQLNASSFLERLHLAYLRINWNRFGMAIVLRPDTMLTKAPALRDMCASERTTYILSGNFQRRYIFHDRDWDFGYIVCDTDLFSVLTINNTTMPTFIPMLPHGFRGCWGHTCERGWRYPYMENVILRHNERGVSLRNADARKVFLRLIRGQSNTPRGVCSS